MPPCGLLHVIVACVPVPVRLTVCGEPEALEVTEKQFVDGHPPL